MARYRVFIKPSAVKELEAVSPLRDRRRIARRIQALGDDPRPPGCEKLSGQTTYRVRQGDHRIVYAVDDAGRAVLVVKVGHRRDLYRRR